MDSYQHPDDLFDVPLREDEMRVKYARKDKLHVFWDPENWGLWSYLSYVFITGSECGNSFFW
jgi:hypothetical protein